MDAVITFWQLLVTDCYRLIWSFKSISVGERESWVIICLIKTFRHNVAPTPININVYKTLWLINSDQSSCRQYTAFKVSLGSCRWQLVSVRWSLVCATPVLLLPHAALGHFDSDLFMWKQIWWMWKSKNVEELKEKMEMLKFYLTID